MSDISNKLQQILTAVYGEEVRGAIHDSIKACYEKTAFDEDVFNEVIDEKIAYLTSLVGSPLKASTAAGMTDTSKIYAYTGSESGYTSGHWYYHNGTSWTDGGVYNSTAFTTDTTLSVSGMAADAKVVGDFKSAIEAYNSKNLITHLLTGVRTTNNIEVTWDSENEQFVIVCTEGTVVSADSKKYVSGSVSTMIAGIEPGGTYYFAFETSDSNITLGFEYYKSGSFKGVKYLDYGKNGFLTVPSTCDSIYVLFKIPAGTVIEDRITVKKIACFSIIPSNYLKDYVDGDFKSDINGTLRCDERFINDGVMIVTQSDLEDGTWNHGIKEESKNQSNENIRLRFSRLIPVCPGMLISYIVNDHDFFFSVINEDGANIQTIGWSTASSNASPIEITVYGFLQIMIANHSDRNTEIAVSDFDSEAESIEIFTVQKLFLDTCLNVSTGTFTDTTKTLADLSDNTIKRCYGAFSDLPSDIPSSFGVYVATIKHTNTSWHQILVSTYDNWHVYIRSKTTGAYGDWTRLDGGRFGDGLRPIYVALGPSTCRGQVWRSGEAVTRTDYPYPEYFGEVCNYEVYNLGNGGTGCIHRNTEANPHPNYMDVIYDPANASVISNARLITIEVPRGNDYNAGYTVGAYDDYFDYEDCIQNHAGDDNGYTWMRNHATIFGALNYCITKIFSMNPLVKLVIIGGLKNSATGAFVIDKINGKIVYTNSQKASDIYCINTLVPTLKQIRDATGIPIIVGDNGSYVTVYNNTLADDGQILGHDGHPTNDGYLAQARYIAGRLESIIKH